MENKICVRCKVEQPISNYGKRKYGYKSYCKNCMSELSKVYIKNNPKVYESTLKKQKEKNKNLTEKERFERNIKRRAYKRGVSIETIIEEERVIELAKSQNKKYCYSCNQILDKECFCKLSHAKDGLNTKCIECCKLITKTYYTNNIDKVNERKKIYVKNNRDKVMSRIKNYVNKRKKVDPIFALSINIRNRIRAVLKYKNIGNLSKKTEEIIGCGPADFKKHIESKFTDGMSWDNHGNTGWHLDHIIPLSSAKTIEEVIKLNHYTNLQPLWATDNLKKGKKIIL